MRSDKFRGKKGYDDYYNRQKTHSSLEERTDLTPEQQQYLEIVRAERERQMGRGRKSSAADRRRRRREYEDPTAYYDPQEMDGGYYRTPAEAGVAGEDPQAQQARRAREYQRSHARRPRPAKRKKRHKVRTAIIMLLILVLLLGGVGLAYFFHLTDNLDTIETADSDFDIDAGVAKELKNYRCVAILGSDARKGEGYDGSRTDAIIIARINKKTDEIQLISVARDSYLQIEDANEDKKLDKITHAHAYGGPVNTCASLNRSLDLNISEFVVFNWQAVADLVDEMGGIEVNIRSNEISDLNQYGPETAENVGKTYTAITSSGKQTLDGTQAATYCRIRKTSGGDTNRGRRMKTVMTALMKKAKQTDLSTLNDVAEKVFPEIRTNLTKGSILTTLAGLGSYEFGDNYSWPKNYYGGMVNGVWYAVPKTLESETEWLHEKAFDQDDYTPTERCKNISDEIITSTGIY